MAGTAFWFVAAMLVKYSGPYLLTEGNAGAYLLYVLTVPLTFGFLFVLNRVYPYQANQIHYVIATVIYSATTLDGIAMTWFSGLYGNDVIIRHHGAGLILWGVAVGLVIGHLKVNKLLPINGFITSKMQMVYAIISVLIWVSGIATVRMLDPGIFSAENPSFIIALVIGILANFIMVYGLVKIAKVSRDAILNTILWLSAPACALDALSFVIKPDLYADYYATSAIVGAYLLWFFGWGIAAAHLIETRQKSA